MSAQHIYTQELVLPAGSQRAAQIFELLSSPTALLSVHAYRSDAVTIKDQHTSPSSSLSVGSSWRESYRDALFLRQWVTVRVVHVDAEALSMRLCLDDGFNLIQQQLQVLPQEADGNGGCCCVRLVCECYQHTATGPVPSAKLAVMFKKADKRLASLAAYLQHSVAAAAIAGAALAHTSVAPVHTPLIPV